MRRKVFKQNKPFYTREAPENIPKGGRSGWNEVMNRNNIKKVIEYQSCFTIMQKKKLLNY